NGVFFWRKMSRPPPKETRRSDTSRMASRAAAAEEDRSSMGGLGHLGEQLLTDAGAPPAGGDFLEPNRLLAARDRVGAAGLERAARELLAGHRRRARDRLQVLDRRLGGRHGLQQSEGVGMARARQHVGGLPLLHHPAAVHDDDSVAD